MLPSFQSKRMLRCYSGCQWQADTLPTHITQNALFSSVSLSFFLHHLFCVLHQYRTLRLHNTVSLLPPEIFSTPSQRPTSGPLSLCSSPSLQTVQGFVYILLVEARHVGMHVPVVVADVAFCAPIGHCAEPEWRREFVRLLELRWGVSGKENTQRKEQ